MATLSVNSLADNVDGSDGVVTLREAILAANDDSTTELGQTGSGADTIEFTGAAQWGRIVLELGPLLVNSPISVDGGTGSIVISGGADSFGSTPSRIFRVDSTAGNVNLRSLTLTGGRAGFGGAIHNSANLTITDSLISGNVATSSHGGGIFNVGGSLTVIGSTIDGNEAVGNGGGIANIDGVLTINQSTISGNTAQGFGGGVADVDGDFVITDSTISDNTAMHGGGIAQGNFDEFGGSGLGIISGSTISGNSAGFPGSTTLPDSIGGGIRSNAYLQVSQSTIAGNLAGLGGGGIASDRETVLSGSIVAGNLGQLANDLAGEFAPSSSFNLIGDSDSSAGLIDRTLDPSNQNIVGVDGSGYFSQSTILEPLANNGGPTFTHALVPGSLAINNGDPSLLTPLPQDQRGFDRDSTGFIDIGSFEFSATGLPSLDIRLVGGDEVLEGNSGTTELQFLVTRNGPSTSSSVDLILEGTISANDASLTTTTVNFVAGGPATQLVSVLIQGDTTLEDDESLAVRLSNPVNATLLRESIATATILNDDASLLVTTLSDENDGALGVGTGDSLREVLQEANANDDLDVIRFDPSLTSGGPATISLNPDAFNSMDGPLTINSEVRIFGPGADRMTIDGSNSGQIFGVFRSNNGSFVPVRIQDLRLTGAIFSAVLNTGDLTIVGSVLEGNGSSAISGGAIHNTDGAKLLLRGSVVRGNVSERGGGIFSDGATAVVELSTIAENRSDESGGGVYNANGSTLTISGSTVRDNTSRFSNGGGIYNVNGPLTIRESTISGNTGGSGSGIYTAGLSTTVISGSTISGNLGEGIRSNNSSNFTMQVLQSTVTGNRVGLSGNFVLHRSIVAGNQLGDVEAGLSPNSSFNLIGDASSAGGLIDRSSDQNLRENIVGIDGNGEIEISTILDPLANNGGPTFSHALVPGSLAIDNGDSSLSPPLPVDQRGYERSSTGIIDIGSFEYQATGLPSLDIQRVGRDEVIEGDSGTTTVQFLVSRRDTSTAVSADLSLGGDISANDASLVTSTVNFLANGAKSQLVSVLIQGDSTLEDDEPLIVKLSNPVNATLSNESIATATILNDDATLLVTTLLDENDWFFHGESLGFGTGDSLREVLEVANASDGLDVIRFDPSLTSGGPATILMSEFGSLQINSEVRIIGPGADRLTIDGNDSSSIFEINAFSIDGLTPVRIQDLRLTRSYGSAIINVSDLTIAGSILEDNSANSDPGGAIRNESGVSLLLSQSTLRNNFSANAGGGIFNASFATTVIENSTIAENSSSIGGGIRSGGGILTISDSTIRDNTATGSGGGVRSNDDLLTISRSTISGNSGARGGGVHNGSTTVISDSTISGNTANTQGGGIFSQTGLQVSRSTITGNSAGDSGGGILSNGQIDLSGSIVAGNLRTEGSPGFPDDVQGYFEPSSTFNLIGDANSAGGLIDRAFDPASQNIVGVDGNGTIDTSTILQPLANNGGPTFTHALVPGSPAIDSGDSSITSQVPADQRGYDRSTTAINDIGSVDFSATGLPSLDIQLVGRDMVLEGDSGTIEVRFLVSRSNTSTTVSAELGLGGDLSGNDASLITSTVNFLANGAASQLVSVLIHGDTTLEGDESFFVKLSNPVNATLSNESIATATILTDDATLLVTTLLDENDEFFNESLGYGTGDSLREVLVAASSGDIIRFAPSLIAAGPATIALTNNSPLHIFNNVRIFGPGSDLLTIDGLDLTTLFDIYNPVSESLTPVRIHDLRLSGAAGSAIVNRGDLVVEGSIFSDNSTFAAGGAISNESHAVLLVTQSTFQNNNASGPGGGIFNAPGATASIDSSTFVENSAQRGGAIANDSGGALTISRSTFSGNSANQSGGGIDSNGSLTLLQSTITGNVVSSPSGGGGLYSTGSTSLQGTIAAGNYDDSGSQLYANDIAGFVDAASEFNLIGDSSTAGGLVDRSSDPLRGNIVGNSGTGTINISTVLYPLAENSGPTPTHGLVADGLAIDASTSSSFIDQRGFSSPVDLPTLNSPRSNASDIGAFEHQESESITLIVDTALDLDNGDTSPGDLSLREAIRLANQYSGSDTIRFDTDGVFATPQTIILNQSSLIVEDGLTIEGPGADSLTLDAQGNSNVFEAFDVSVTGSLFTIRGVTLANGSGFNGAAIVGDLPLLIEDSILRNNTAQVSGGAIHSLADVTIRDTTLTQNMAGEFGGAIYLQSGNLMLIESSVTNNTVLADGGGIYLDSGVHTISGSTIEGNEAMNGLGGGINVLNSELRLETSTVTDNEADTGGGLNSDFSTLTIRDSTLSNNHAKFEGGGVSTRTGVGALPTKIIQSTISGNTADEKGGGVFVFDGELEIESSTITRNAAPAGAGSGIGNAFAVGVTTKLRSTIVSGNVNSDVDVASQVPTSTSFISNGSNIIGTGNAEAFFTASDMTGVIDPKLEPLANYGGPTATHALKPDSPAINNGDATGIVTDQRGEPFLRNIDGGIDVGSFELQSIDFGDAPASYDAASTDLSTFIPASHRVTGPRLGAFRDGDFGPTFSNLADGDDLAGFDDEDGVLFGEIQPGSMAGINIDLQNAPAGGRVDAWIDFDDNGTFDLGEQILDNFALAAGLQTINYNVPTSANAGVSFARVRVSTLGNLNPIGASADGEVEDYTVTIGPVAIIASAQANPGQVSRSEITSIEVEFDSVVEAVPSDFVLRNTTTDQVITGIAVSLVQNGEATLARLSFTGGDGVISSQIEGVPPSLADGGYELYYRPASLAGVLDESEDAIDSFFRKYGDADGSDQVGLADFAIFRGTFGLDLADLGFNSGLDANRDGSIGLADFAAFRGNFGT